MKKMKFVRHTVLHDKKTGATESYVIGQVADIEDESVPRLLKYGLAEPSAERVTPVEAPRPAEQTGEDKAEEG